MMVSTASAISFVQKATQMASHDGLIVASIDFDQMGKFLNRHGAVATHAITEMCRRRVEDCLRRAVIDEYVILQSSFDEMLILCRHSNPERLVVALRQAQRAIGEEVEHRFPGSELGFTAAVCSTDHCSGCTFHPRLWAACVNCEREIHLQKKTGRQGEVYIVRRSLSNPCSELAANHLRATIWQLVNTSAISPPESAAPLDTFLADANLPQPVALSLIAIRPLFGGEQFIRMASSLDGGTYTLPTGQKLGKLGFLNRALDHLTANLLIELTVAWMLETCPARLIPDSSNNWACRFSLNLYCWIAIPTTLSENDLMDQLLDWLQAARSLFSRHFSPELDIPVFQAAAIPSGSPFAHDIVTLGEHLFTGVRPEIYQLEGCVALYDYRTAPESRISEAIKRVKEELKKSKRDT